MKKYDEYRLYAENTKSIKMVEHGELPLVLFNYTPECVYSRDWNEITINSRGHMFNKETKEPIANPLPKFFNHNEEVGGLFLDSKLEDFLYATKKEDGSMGFTYVYDGKIYWATRGSFASTQSQEAQKIWNEFHGVHINDELQGFIEEHTLIAEIISPETRVVVDYGGARKLVLLAVRNIKTGEELSYSELEELGAKLNMEVVKKFSGYSLYGMLELSKTLNVNEEGWILHYKGGQRAKVKGTAYLEAHRVLYGLSEKAKMAAWRDAKVEDIMKTVPEEFQEEFEQYFKDLDDKAETLLEKFIREYLKNIKPLDTKKEKAICILNLYSKPYTQILFALLNGKPGQDYLAVARNVVYLEWVENRKK